MNCYTMKALTRSEDWFEFTMRDLPTLFMPNEFALLGRPGTPRLNAKTIRRGDVETGLYEGDIISMEDDIWLICYERGFYAINSSYIVRYLYALSDYNLIGTNLDTKAPVPINFREKHLFKYGDVVFRINDIVGAYQGKLLLRSVSKPVSPEDIKQECCLSYKGSRIYLGDETPDGIVELHGGRITLNNDGKLTDIITGGELNGYNT